MYCEQKKRDQDTHLSPSSLAGPAIARLGLEKKLTSELPMFLVLGAQMIQLRPYWFFFLRCQVS
jgi:hypothetical protein